MSAKRNILFVDDEPNVLHGLKRMLRSMRNEWDMSFCPGGQEALQILDEGAFDVVVSDYKSGSAGDWDQLKLYSMVLLGLIDCGLPEDPKLMKGFFRLIKAAKTAKKVKVYPAEARMELYTRPKSTLSFTDLDDEFVQTFDEIFETREFMPGTITGRKATCYFCDFNLECEGLIDRVGGW